MNEEENVVRGSKKNSNEFVHIPIRILKKEKYNDIDCTMQSDNNVCIKTQTDKDNREKIEQVETKNIGRTIPIRIKSEGTPKEKGKYITIKVQEDEARKNDINPDKLQREHSQNTFPIFQSTAAKPPSGSQTLPTPRKDYHALNGRLRFRQGIGMDQTVQLPFGGGQEFEQIQAELQSAQGKLSAQIEQINANKIENTESSWTRSQSVEAENRKPKERIPVTKHERSLRDIDKDIATIWKEIKEFEETPPANIETENNTSVRSVNEKAKCQSKYVANIQPNESPDYESIPLPAPPLPPKSLHRSSSLSSNHNRKRSMHTIKERPPVLPPRNTSLTRSNSLPLNEALQNLKPCLKPNSRSNSVTRCSRSRSQTPNTGNKVSFKVEGNKAKVLDEDTEVKENPFEWVDFKKYEGLPRGIIQPDELVNEDSLNIPAAQTDKQNKNQNENKEHMDSTDDEEYFSADDEDLFMERDIPKQSCITADVATQTDPLICDDACTIM
eukprot:GFUD01002604.1.p1 GENE.GFUD01002604.1~~GFUD01002604.1.p1  ORF type:complete len:498 (+),score=149.88 GFUD01002604.1:413-1906(+)